MDLFPQQAALVVLTLVQELDQTQNDYEEAMRIESDTQEVVTVATAIAWAETEGKNREEREAYVEAEVADLQRFLDYATGRAKATAKRVDGKRQALSSMQTVARMIEEESQHSRMGPEGGQLDPDEARATLALAEKMKEMEREQKGRLSGHERVRLPRS